MESQETKVMPDDVVLIGGGIGKREAKTACLMSAVAWLAGLPHSDTPECACAVIRPLAIALNDGNWWRDSAERTAALLPLARRLVGSASTAARYAADAAAAGYAADDAAAAARTTVRDSLRALIVSMLEVG